MKHFSWRALMCGLLIVCGLLSALPNFLPSSISARLPHWYTDNTLSLGLDLQGGSHLLLQADMQALMAQSHAALADEAGSRLREAGIRFRIEDARAAPVQLRLLQPEQLPRAQSLLHELSRDPASGIKRFRMQAEGSMLTLALTEQWQAQLGQDAIDASLEVVRRRLNESGLVEPVVARQGEDAILVQMPGVADPGEVRTLLGTTARMTFHWVLAPGEAGASMVLPAQTGEERYRVAQDVALEGRHIRDAQLGFNPETGAAVVNFRLDNEGGRTFARMTADNIGRPLAIVLDDAVLTAPVIRSVIAGGSGEISGDFTPQEAGELALMLRAGALPVPLQVIEERTVGPDLGSDAIAMGLATGLAGAALVVAFMLAVYRGRGLVACLGLLLNLVLMLGILSLFRATLTLPGIAGIILTLGMAVDANILINERIREEGRQGRSAGMAVKEGFARAYRTILDSNLTTLIAVSLLFLVGSGPVKGFAVTIGIGLLTSLFTAVTLTRLLTEWQIRGRERQPLVLPGVAWLDRLSARVPNVMRGRRVGLTLSAVLSLAAVLLYVQPGLKYGVDFTGGTLMEVRAPGVAADDLRQVLPGQASVQESEGEGHYLVRLPVAQEPTVAAEQMEALKASVRDLSAEAEFPRTEMVGPKVSGDFSDISILAVLLAGAGVLGYLWWRFESHFALAATLTIALDLTKTIGFFVLAGVEFNLTAVAALLALIGYSVNDKVVVFDRVREQLRLTPDKPLLDVLNESIAATLTRTVFTSVTTLLALLPMALAGGAAVVSFAQPLLFGVIVGTSSSVFIAAPLLYWLARRRARRGLAQLQPTAEEVRQQLAQMP